MRIEKKKKKTITPTTSFLSLLIMNFYVASFSTLFKSFNAIKFLLVFTFGKTLIRKAAVCLYGRWLKLRKYCKTSNRTQLSLTVCLFLFLFYIIKVSGFGKRSIWANEYLLVIVRLLVWDVASEIGWAGISCKEKFGTNICIRLPSNRMVQLATQP